MIQVLSTNILSPLGRTTMQNYRAVKEGKSAFARYAGYKGIPETITASLFSDEDMSVLMIDGFSKFESMAIRSMQEALTHAGIDHTSHRTICIISSTKADVEHLEDKSASYSSPGASAQKIAKYLNFANPPVSICNACISGVSAQLLAQRLIDGGMYDYAVVCGADSASKFTIAGFLSLKSLSPVACKPFDIERLGLNLGEAAATIVFGKATCGEAGLADFPSWCLLRGGQTNDAYHLSAPVPDGNGTRRAIQQALADFPIQDLSCVSVHGTATMFNDQMESRAIEAAGLSDVPLSAIKGFYGHTMGAAGILETIITMAALDDGVVLPTRGYEEIGVSGRISISNQMREVSMERQAFLKVISGFGGCNGALLFAKGGMREKTAPTRETEVLKTIRIASGTEGKELLNRLYRERGEDYPKFHKMDVFARLCFLATEMLLDNVDEKSDIKVFLFNNSSTIVSDLKHIANFNSPAGFFPSPSVFLYTLPNIAVGEIAIRHHITDETSLFLLPAKDWRIINEIVKVSCESRTRVMAGWVDCPEENSFEADFKLLTIK